MRKFVGVQEALLAFGVVLITCALWPSVGQLAFLPAGGVLVWLALPSRVPFVQRRTERRP